MREGIAAKEQGPEGQLRREVHLRGRYVVNVQKRIVYYGYSIENGYLSHQGEIQLIRAKECGLIWTPKGSGGDRGGALFGIYGRAWPHLSSVGAMSHRYAFSSLHLPFSEGAESERGLAPQSHHLWTTEGPSDVEVSTLGV